MADQTVVCPHCGKLIPLTEALTKRIEAEIRERFDVEYLAKLEAEAAKREAKARQESQREYQLQLEDLRAQIEDKDKKLAENQKRELELLKQQRDLEDREREIELVVARRLAAERAEIEKAATERLEEQHRLREREKDEKLAALTRQIEELKRRADQGSQQSQGEAGEAELESQLASNFPGDQLEPVPKGKRGGDILQRVYNASGQCCGTILWEAKNTKNWNDAWLAKAKDDQREAKAEVAVIVSVALPKGSAKISLLNGVWVADFSVAVGLATVLRNGLTELAMMRMSVVDRAQKMDLLYAYLCGSEFRQRVEAVVEAFCAMKRDLDSEKTAMQKLWAKREKEIERVSFGLAGMMGDLQGIVGGALPKIERLELPSGDESGAYALGG